MRLYSRKDVDKKALRGARIAVLGYGSQGRAHALNLRDSGYDVVVGVRKGDSWTKAKKDGLAVMEPAAAVKGANLVAMLVPDLTQKPLYAELKTLIEKGATLLFAHGFNIHFKQIKPRKDLDVILIAPWLLHRHEKLWRDPNAFIPSRFMPGAPPPDRFAYLPFGVGARVCIGAHFALVEATLALAKIIGAFRIELLDREPVIPVGVVTTQPDRSPMFRITPR